MRKRNISATLALAVILAGCSSAPMVEYFPPSSQLKFQAAANWDVIANDVAKQLASSFKGKPALPLLYVNQAGKKTEFERAFGNQLITALVAEGFAVHKSHAGALIVDVDTQVVWSSTATPQTEIVVTTSVSDSNQFFARMTSVYYFNSSDSTLYRAPSPAPVRTFNVIGG